MLMSSATLATGRRGDSAGSEPQPATRNVLTATSIRNLRMLVSPSPCVTTRIRRGGIGRPPQNCTLAAPSGNQHPRGEQHDRTQPVVEPPPALAPDGGRAAGRPAGRRTAAGRRRAGRRALGWARGPPACSPGAADRRPPGPGPGPVRTAGARPRSDAAADRARNDWRLPPAGSAQQRLRHGAARGRRGPRGRARRRRGHRAGQRGSPHVRWPGLGHHRGGLDGPQRRGRPRGAGARAPCRRPVPARRQLGAGLAGVDAPRRLDDRLRLPAGDHSGAVEMPVEATLRSWLYLSRVEVAASAATRVVSLGGSLYSPSVIG